MKLRSTGETKLIYDVIRKIWVKLTPEEFVRQHVIHFLMEIKKVPASYINIESSGNKLNKQRTDIRIYNKLGGVWLVVECKSPTIEINNQTQIQATQYAHKYRADYMMLTNGVTIVYAHLNERLYTQLLDIPNFS
ncbi:MAG: type I restriction enzyme HsdR N-terminal domain-containing protein [Bacteroidota bacterium]|nr:type I restriction enzyme HsdR N-terminal domain-containing protein [Bacteroidota bacterium]